MRERILFEQTLIRLENSLAAHYRPLLNHFLRQFGILYLDGLPNTTDKQLERLFVAGLKAAEKGLWEKALTNWKEAKGKSSGRKLVTLQLLCGQCYMLLKNNEAAQKEFDSATSLARRIGALNAEAVGCFFSALLAKETGHLNKAERLLRETVRIAHVISNNDLAGKALTKLAETLALSSKIDEALIQHRAALRIFENVGDHRGAITQYIAIGDLLFQKGEFDQARAAYEDGLHLSREFRNRWGEAEHLTAIGRIHREQRDYKRALDVLERALGIYRDLNYLRGQARVLYELGLLHERTDSIDIAREFFEQALSFARRANDKKLIARNLVGLAFNCILHNNYSSAHDLLNEAIAIDRAHNTQKELASDMILLGHLYNLEGKASESISILEEALAISQRNFDYRHEAKAMLELIVAYRSRNETKKAKILLEQLWKLVPRSKDDKIVAEAYFLRGLLKMDEKDWVGGLSDLKKALTLHRQFGIRHAIIEDLYYIALTLCEQKQYQSAYQQLQEALPLVKGSPGILQEARIYLALGEIQLRLGNPEEAQKSIKQASEIFHNAGDLSKEALCFVKLGEILLERSPEEAHYYWEQALSISQKLDDKEKILAIQNQIHKILKMKNSPFPLIDKNPKSTKILSGD